MLVDTRLLYDWTSVSVVQLLLSLGLLCKGVQVFAVPLQSDWWVLRLPAGLITPSDFVRMVSTAVAQTYNVYPRKGLIAPGSDADIIVFDPEVEHTISASTHHSKMDTNIYEGRDVTGKVTSCQTVCLYIVALSAICFVKSWPFPSWNMISLKRSLATNYPHGLRS